MRADLLRGKKWSTASRSRLAAAARSPMVGRPRLAAAVPPVADRARSPTPAVLVAVVPPRPVVHDPQRPAVLVWIPHGRPRLATAIPYRGWRSSTPGGPCSAPSPPHGRPCTIPVGWLSLFSHGCPPHGRPCTIPHGRPSLFESPMAGILARQRPRPPAAGGHPRPGCPCSVPPPPHGRPCTIPRRLSSFDHGCPPHGRPCTIPHGRPSLLGSPTAGRPCSVVAVPPLWPQ